MKRLFLAAFLVLVTTSAAFAEDFFSFSGSLDLRGIIPLDSRGPAEYPSLTGKFKIDTPPSTWRFHSWIEGGWDGSVRLPAKDHAVLKTFDEVYQSNTPYLELKETYLAYSTDTVEVRAGIQRYAWGRLDEYPINDLLNPWDYTQFLRKPLEDRKIGVPSLSATINEGIWGLDLVWVPVMVPYRLAQPNERWSGIPEIGHLADLPGVDLNPNEPNLPARTLKNGNAGMRIRYGGDIECALNLYHGYDPRPVFQTTAFSVASLAGRTLINPGYVPDFHKMTSIGMDAATVAGAWSFRGEAAYALGRYFNTQRQLWGHPATLTPGIHFLNPAEHKSDSLEYGVGADYRLFEDCVLTMQAQQLVIMNRPDTLYERKFETLFWANVKTGWLNQKVETNLNLAYNPEHGDMMVKANAFYTFTDNWKAGVTAVTFSGNPQSLFGRFYTNDQLEAEVVFAW
jgi:hypothetical protein